jgi:hypothetical protein
MSEDSRVKRWRQNKRQHGLKAVTIWVTEDEELRLKDLALQWHCSPSTVVQRALAQVGTSIPPQHSSPADALLIRELIREELAVMQAAQSPATVGDTVGPTDTQPQEPTPATAPAHEYKADHGHDLITESVPPAAPPTRPPPGQYKLTARQAASLRAKRARGTPIRALMEEYGISRATLFRYLKDM